MRRIDLHAHTDHSDGTLTPTQLVQAARDAGLAALAVTDHDTTSALREALEAGAREGVEVIEGCEVSAAGDPGVLHVLAYGFDRADAAFQAFLRVVRAGRERRNGLILDRLAALGVPVSHEEVLAQVKGAIVARPHIAQALVRRGHAPDVREAFARWLKDGGPAHAEADLPPAVEAVRAIRLAGGVAVLAHPRQARAEGREAYARLLGRLVAEGLAGLEVDHPSQDPAERAFFRSLAEEFDLVASGGSDFHGAHKPHLRLGVGDGTVQVPYETWERLRARRGA